MDFIKLLPKIELHAHLNGSLSNETLIKLQNLKSPGAAIEPEFYQITTGGNLTFDQCFQKFKYAHNLTTTKTAITLAAKCMIEDFAKENTIYLEIRSHPRELPELSREEYLQAIIDAILEAPIMVKLLVSINRANGVKCAEKNVAAALAMKEKYPEIVKGMDLSGDPLQYTFADFRPALEMARKNGLKMALHCAEVKENFDDIRHILEFGPERVGHGTFIRKNDATNWKLYTDKRPLVECCLTSNIKSGTVKEYENHHFGDLFKQQLPVAICTDDFGVFETNLTKEIELAAEHNGLKEMDLINLMLVAVEHSFASGTEKKRLQVKIEEFEEEWKRRQSALLESTFE